MIRYRIGRFLDAWEEGGPTMRAFLLWNASNTVLAFALAGGAVLLLPVAGTPGFQRAVLFAYTALAVAWTLSVFLIGPAYERVGPTAEETP